MSSSLTSKTIKGVKWTTTSTIATTVMQMGYIAVMGRLLTPAAFGLVAFANVVLRFGTYFASMGLGQAIIQKNSLSEKDKRAAFTSSFLLGLVFTVLLYVLAPLSIYLVEDNELIPVLRVMALSFFIVGLSSTSISLLRRNIRFKEIATIEIVSYIVAYMFVGLGMAHLGYGIWSLILASLVQSIIYGICSYYLERHSLYFLFGWKHYKPLFSYGSKISVISFTEFIGLNLDTMIIGKFLGPANLGYYNRGFLLVNLPMYFFTTSFAKVLFPSFSKIQSDTVKLKGVYLSSITLVAAIILPVAAGIIVAASEIVLVMLGSGWEKSIPVLQISAIGVSLSLITMFAGVVCDATANLKYKIILSTCHIFILAALIALFKNYGLIGFAFAISVGQLLRTFAYFPLINSILKSTYHESFRVYFPGILNSVVVAGGIFAITILVRDVGFSPLLILICQIFTGGILLLVSVFLVPLESLKIELQNFITKLNLSEFKEGRINKLIHSYSNYIKK